MDVRFLSRWRTVPAGATRDIPDGAANVLIRRGICEVVQPPRQTRKASKNDAK